MVLSLAFVLYQSSPPPLYVDGIGHYHRAVPTRTKKAKAFFDQGLAMLYGFHKAASHGSFLEAARLDPKCCLAWWGAAMALGPDINFPAVDQATSVQAIDHLKRARQTARTRLEKGLLAAAELRFADPAPTDRSKLDKAYSDAMAKLYARYPRDPDVASLYAESLMILLPWNIWTSDQKLKPEVAPALVAVKRALKLSPDHLMANHLMIHLMEGTDHPEAALRAAHKLENLTPRLGHLVHMPSHIYVRTGDWQPAIVQNQRALGSDGKFFNGGPPPFPYAVYTGHNRMMLAYAATMNGDQKTALEAADQALSLIPPSQQKEMADTADQLFWLKYEVQKRFGLWDAILAEPQPADYLPLTTAMWRGDRAIALAAKHLAKEAEAELALYKEAAAKVNPERAVWNNTADKVLKIESALVEGELAAQSDRLEEAFSHLNQAVEAEDQLGYDEPPDWFQPTRHTLGAALLKAGKPQQAVEVYQADLQKVPNNAWSLLGMAQALDALNQPENAAKFRAKLAAMWKGQSPMTSSCLCMPNPGK